MSLPKRIEYAEAFRARLLRHVTTLLPEPDLGEFEAVASYVAEDGRRIFAFCLNGLLIDPDGDSRFIPFAQISATDYYDDQRLRTEKRTQMYRSIILTLCDGEKLELPLNQRTDGFSERLAVGVLIEQRIRLARIALKDATQG